MRRTALSMLAGLPLGRLPRPAAAASAAEARQAEALAAAEFADAHGAPHWLSELGRPLVLVNLWAAWCPGCVIELPTLRWLSAHLGPNAIDVVLLSHGMNWAGDVAYAREAGLTFRHWRLTMQASAAVVAAVFRIKSDRFALPQSVAFAGRDRAPVWSHQGSLDWTTPEQVRLARAWLAAVT